MVLKAQLEIHPSIIGKQRTGCQRTIYLSSLGKLWQMSNQQLTMVSQRTCISCLFVNILMFHDISKANSVTKLSICGSKID